MNKTQPPLVARFIVPIKRVTFSIAVLSIFGISGCGERPDKSDISNQASKGVDFDYEIEAIKSLSRKRVFQKTKVEMEFSKESYSRRSGEAYVCGALISNDGNLFGYYLAKSDQAKVSIDRVYPKPWREFCEPAG